MILICEISSWLPVDTLTNPAPSSLTVLSLGVVAVCDPSPCILPDIIRPNRAPARSGAADEQTGRRLRLHRRRCAGPRNDPGPGGGHAGLQPAGRGLAVHGDRERV